MDPLILTGSSAPLFTLADLSGQPHHIEEQRGRIVILNFWSCECPWSQRADTALLEASAGWDRHVVIWTIASNVNEPDEQIRYEATQRSLTLVLRDAGARIANLYGAQTTPHLFVIDDQGILRYQGALDNVTFRNRTPSVDYLRQAVDALLSGSEVNPAETPPYGCTIVRAFATGG